MLSPKQESGCDLNFRLSGALRNEIQFTNPVPKVIPALSIGTNAEYGRIPGAINKTITKLNNPLQVNHSTLGIHVRNLINFVRVVENVTVIEHMVII